MNTNWSDIFGGYASAEEIAKAQSNDENKIAVFLSEQWDEMYGDDPEAVKPADFTEFARQIITEAQG